MRVPYEKFIRYLLLTGHTDKEVIDLLTSFGISKIGTVYLSDLRSQIEKEASPKLKQFLNNNSHNLISKMHRSDMQAQWLTAFHLEDVHNGDPQYSEAFSIFSDKTKRNYMNIYILCGDMSNVGLCEIFERKFDSNISENGLIKYRELFFDDEIMSPIDWQNYVIQFPPRLRVLYEAAPLKKSKYIQWKLGDHVEIDPYYIFNELSKDFFFLTRDAHLEKKSGWQDDAVKFANVALGASDRASRAGKAGGKNHHLDLVKLVEQSSEMPEFDDLCESDE